MSGKARPNRAWPYLVLERPADHDLIAEHPSPLWTPVAEITDPEAPVTVILYRSETLPDTPADCSGWFSCEDTSGAEGQ